MMINSMLGHEARDNPHDLRYQILKLKEENVALKNENLLLRQQFIALTKARENFERECG